MRKKAVNLLLELPIIRYKNHSANDSPAEDNSDLDSGVWVEEGGGGQGVDESGGTEESEDAVMVDVSQEGDGGGQTAKVDIPLLEESTVRTS
ncbi:hypothetical protein CVT24_006448 [Panaeolus cyanescens]|uniref:Uncharacterized protein n=1 Tax=Panaeolus cyanescens TaxID=181874 RepID=A0A409X3I6_9AGAR|nr:hypothetical protein CVT24_006448 [Panaeolus cyanescens]